MNILKIDTSDNLKTKIELELSGKTFTLKEERKNPSEQNVLEIIERLLKNKKIKLNELTAIEVNSGPGSYTGTRVGVGIANALSFSLGIPVNGKKISEMEIPKY